jgi:magnesium-protoporphyrin IX monomethyl ester (oxidative) cyclase
MYKITLINMPFADCTLPSIALTQLKSLVEVRFPETVAVDIVYLNHDFSNYFGSDRYSYISFSMLPMFAGLGDWLFRHLAFPSLPDNTEKYLQRFFFGKGKEVQLIKEIIADKRPNLGAFMDELITTYKLDQSQMVGFTSMFQQNAACFAMAKKLKQRNPEIITVMGGANCEFPMGGVIAEQVQDIDFVFSGPASKSFPEFVEYCMDGTPSKGRSIRGVFSRGVPRPQSSAETFGEELSIDTPIELDYEDFIRKFDTPFVGTEIKPVITIETSRGCWWGQRSHCTFCGLNGASMAYRAMKPELAIQLFNTMFRYSGRSNSIQAVDNILPKNYLEQVLPFLETPADMDIFYEVKADLNEQEIAVLAKARVNRIQPGIESLATSTLKLMKKGTSAVQNVNFLKMCADYGVQPFWNLLVGFPGEGADVYRRYMEFLPSLTHLEPPSGVYPVRFDRFSPYHTQAESYGLDLHPMEFYSFVYPFDEASLVDFAYYFSDRNLLADYFTTIAQWLGKLQALIKQWHARWKDSKLPPRLRFSDGSGSIYDSRSGTVVYHSVGELGTALLRFLSKPARMDGVVRAFSAESETDVSGSIALLRGKGLIFEEGDRMISLVFDGDYGDRFKKSGQSPHKGLPVISL